MSLIKNEWLDREAQFSAFATGPLLTFWQTRLEGGFTGVDGLPIRYVAFRHPQHQKVMIIVSGRIECYVKYQELVYDLYHSGYDVLMMDHRGQGFSGRLLEDTNRGHVIHFDDYVDDLATFIHDIVQPSRYLHAHAIAHSMGGTVLSLLLAREPKIIDAAVLASPMVGIKLPLPYWMAKKILDRVEPHPRWHNHYAPGTGFWRPLPFVINQLTHSRVRYQRFLRFYADMPTIRVGGPTYHWVRESMLAGERMIASAAAITTPILLLQASEDRVVENRAQMLFSQAMDLANHPLEGGAPKIVEGARHELFFERDAIRVGVLRDVLYFLSQH